MDTWTRQPQECPGDYFFSGRAFMTAGVQAALSPDRPKDTRANGVRKVARDAERDSGTRGVPSGGWEVGGRAVEQFFLL